MKVWESSAASPGQGAMVPTAQEPSREPRLALVFLALWCAFIVYTSFIPFHLALGDEEWWKRRCLSALW
jgi:hypothetical protein